MTKAEIIARYGEEYYAAHLAKSKANAKIRYWEKPETRKTAEESTAAVRRWLEKPENRVRFNAANLVRQNERYASMNPTERRALYEKRYAARKAKLASDHAFRAEQAAKQSVRAERWNQAHPGVRNARAAAYEKANPHVKRANKQSRRARGKIDPEFVKFLRSQPCLDCGATDKPITIGHSIPIKHGGTNHPCNLIAQCRSCNSKQNSNLHTRAMLAHYPQAARFAVA